jgi:hypothetical protein
MSGKGVHIGALLPCYQMALLPQSSLFPTYFKFIYFTIDQVHKRNDMVKCNLNALEQALYTFKLRFPKPIAVKWMVAKGKSGL